MKTWKNLTVLAMVAIITLALAGCKDDPPDPKVCTCNPKAHLGIGETCECGGTDCTSCGLQIYGTVGGVNIYRKGIVSTMSEAVTKVENAYDSWTFGYKSVFSEKIGRIIIVLGSEWDSYEENGKHTVEIGADMSVPAIRIVLGFHTIE